MSDTEGESEHLPRDPETGDYGSTSSYLEEEESEKSIYDPEKFISGPELSENSTLRLDLLEFDFSYGYDCLKYFNLTVLDERTLVFSTGNFINFFDVSTRRITFRRSALGGGVGHIRKNGNPEYPYFAVAECGNVPVIVMYTWPDMEIVCVLKGGASRTYANMDFNPDGDLLVSQSGKPDFLITIWDWQHHTILLRTKSYVNDVYRVKFSPYVAGQLTTCGLAHIKFWKMASTFTGLKLQGELGRFGKTEYSDIIGVLPMPDAKVVSGCEWGNILVWDDGLITFEVFRSLRKKCHDAPIVQFFYVEGELWTVSMDGHVKVWWFDKIDQADPPDDDRVILVDPTYDFYTKGVKLMSIEKRKPGDSGDTWWYAQDGNGGIWLIDLNTEEEPKPAQRLYRCHGGKIKGLAACPWGPYLATLGELGSFFLYNYVTKTIVLDYTFPASGTSLIWLPIKVVETGEIFIGGFGDGQVRVCCLHIPNSLPSEEGVIKLTVAQVVKPHNKPLVTMSVNPQGNLLVTAGEDSNIFLFRINPDSHSNFLVPIGFYPTTDLVTYITWHPTIENEVLLGCLHGQMMQIQLPGQEQSYTGVSFKLQLNPQCNIFTSYKSQIKRDIKLREIEERKARKRAKKMEEMEQIKKDNPGLEIDEEVFLADSESEEELEPLYFPDVPNRIIWLKYTANETIWLSMAGYDAGYIYEYRIDQKDTVPVNFKLLDGAENTEISTFVYTSNQAYLVFAMEDGSIRINKVNPSDYTDLSDYFMIAMHDNQNGFVPKLTFSYDEKYLFSCGYDGNIFAYKFNPKDHTYPHFHPRSYRDDHFCTPTQDTETYQKLSLEEIKIKAEDDRVQKLATEHKNKIREVLKTLKERYKKLLLRNSKLLESQVVPRQVLEPDQRVAEYVNQIFAGKVEIVRRKLAYDVEKSRILVNKLLDYFITACDRHPFRLKGINDPDCDILTVRQRKMPDLFFEMFDIIAQKLKEEEGKGRPPERAQPPQKATITKIEQSKSPLEFFLLSLTPEDIAFRLGPKLTRMLKKYRRRRVKWERRAGEWEEFLAKKPIPGRNHPDDEKFLEEAKISFGDYKLKEHKDYKVPPEERETTVKHYKKLLETRAMQYNLRHNFTEIVIKLREYKYELIEKLREKQRTIQFINEELPEEFRRNGPPVPEFDPDEFPEEKLQVKVALPEEGDLDERSYKSTFVEEPSGDTLLRQLTMPSTYPTFVDGTFQSIVPNEEVLNMADKTFEELLDYPENLDTPYEACLKTNRLNKLLIIQKLEISEMQSMIDDFNDRIYQARKDRLPVLIKGNFIDIFIVCLNEEMRILKSCEQEEDKLLNNVNAKLKDVHDMEDFFDSLKIDRENQETKLENLKVEENKIQDKFKSAVENNKFYDFLKKVFKKKFKPPKIKTDDDSSSSSSSSSEDSDDFEDGDNGSIDSKDFGFIKQDLNVCPKGCEPALFNFTIDLRSKRHEVEQSEREEQRVLEQTKKDMGVTMRKLEILKRSYGVALNELENFRRDKQDKLNHVRCTVVLNLDQVYGNLRNQDIDISDFLVFSKSKLSDLYKRVKLLHRDSLEEQGKHELGLSLPYRHRKDKVFYTPKLNSEDMELKRKNTYLKHLMRMRKDIIYMQLKAHCLKRDIKRLLKIKFGKEVDINELEMAVLQRSFQKNMVNELEEVVLKKLVYEMRIKKADVRGIYIAALERWQRKIVESQQELTREIKENTRRLELLAVIRKEKKDLVKFVETQDKRLEKVEQMEIIHKEFTKDLQKLQNIIEEQNMKLLELKEEIKLLKTKGMAQEVQNYSARRKSHEKDKRKKEEREEKWIDYDDYASKSEDDEEDYDDETEMLEGDRLAIQQLKTEVGNYYFSESEDLVRDLVEDLLKNVNADLMKKSTEDMVDSILRGIMKCASIRDMINEIVDNLPVKDLSEEQLSSVKQTASKLMSLQEPQVSDENVMACVKDILDETLSDVLCTDPNYLIPKMLEKLVDNLPLELLMSSEPVLDEIGALNCIMQLKTLTIKSSVEGTQLDQDELRKSLEELPLEAREDVKEILKEILKRVYDTGIDFLYVINQFSD